MARTVEYQGYTIQSAPGHPVDGKKWQLRIFISVQDHRGVNTREFSAEVLYATEPEADIHGIACGQRLIDGKVEGWSVTDMKTMDRRTTPRLRVQFRTTFSASTPLEGTGRMLDLSAGGCRIESTVTVEAGMSLELRVQAPDLEWPLMIEAASVQWVSGRTFGLAFFRIRETELERLGQVIHELTESQSAAEVIRPRKGGTASR
ncbi:MAG: PilZ domain-containing protein [Nitrospiraceae bacterium]